MTRSLLLLGLLALAIVLSGCAGTESQESPNEVSTIPWNRPQNWEGPGALGGMMNTN